MTSLKYKDPQQIFWENVERYSAEYNISVKKALMDISSSRTTVNRRYNNYINKTFPESLPMVMRDLIKYFNLQYIDLFEDWSD
ncbi:hypothetical protein [Pseudolactococcus insecticola]|uniref:Transcriptional regulator n=1 Tax=Pseudolactococcus insecticola TaxID=2709158 RepID=A0A6A0B3D2_9LACT|nr:hypothetical protein [Lactococcus insecticola]GFH39830.1 hypothetical protein Hs20B_02280 [Lactococcus insecticola]